MATAWVITVSDRCFRGDAEDRSGPALVDMLERSGIRVEGRGLVPDEPDQIIIAVQSGIDAGAGLIVTTGGTGLAERDVTPQTVAPLLDYEVPGLAEEMRRAGAANTPNALLSRSVAGVRGRTLILNLPGSLAGATESLASVLPVVGHALQMLEGDAAH